MALVGNHSFLQQKTHSAVVIAWGATSAVDLVVSGWPTLLLAVRMTASVVGDITVAVQPYEDDGTTLFAQNLPTQATGTVAAAVVGGVVRLQNAYSLLGVSKVNVQITNNHAGPETVSAIAYLLD